jgi:hypothetical protein
MLHGVDFNAKKFVHILVTPISPSWNTFSRGVASAKTRAHELKEIIYYYGLGKYTNTYVKS